MPAPSIDFYNAAIDALQAGHVPEALTAVENSLTEDPDDGQTWQLYVVILNALGRTEDARKATVTLKEKGLNEIDELLMKAAQSTVSGNLAEAIAHYETALDLEPDRAEIQTSYALALMQNGDAAGALGAAEKAVALDPEDGHSHYALGHILRVTGKTAPALASLSRAVAIDPEFMMALYEEGMLLAETGRLPEALANFEKFLKARPGDSSATEAVASLRKSMGGGRPPTYSWG